jgi:hypothetical protein
VRSGRQRFKASLGKKKSCDPISWERKLGMVVCTIIPALQGSFKKQEN